jgi:isoleucyl-tRNA synthetase
VRCVQDARKQAGLEVSDRIVLSIEGTNEIEAVIRIHRDYITAETLTTHWAVPGDNAFIQRHSQGDQEWTIRLARDSEANERQR